MFLCILLIFNCGGAAAAAAGLGGTQWLGDAAAEASTYDPGQKSIRLHFNSLIYDQFDNTTALERVHYRHIKWGSATSDDDVGSMFGMWGSSIWSDAKMANSKTWTVSVDVGFKYLVRLHLCDVGLEMDSVLLIDNIVVLTDADLRGKKGNMLWYNDYMVMVEGREEEEYRDISVSLHSHHAFLDRHGPLEGFEVFKLRNDERSLASPSPLDSPQTSLHYLLYNRRLCIKLVDYTILYVILLTTIMIVTLFNLEHKMSVDNFTKELQLPVEIFHDGRVLGRGGSGKVYRGHIDNGIEFVVFSLPPSPGFNQWEYRFWTEVEMLSYRFWTVVAMLYELLRVNLVFFNEDCIFVYAYVLYGIVGLNELLRVDRVFFIEDCGFAYEYMLYGIFGDYLYRLARESDDFCHQDHDICIESSRVLDYLHRGQGLLLIDLKASTMRLDKKLEPNVSDFGLAKIGRGGLTLSQHIRKFKGSSEYLDAVFSRTSKQTENIFSFGALVLEILCGRPAPPWNEQDKGAIKYISEGQVDHIVAPSMRGEISSNSLKTFLKIAEGPLLDEQTKRPNIAQILTKLQYALPEQEKAESDAMNVIRSLFSSMLTSRDTNMYLPVPTFPSYYEPGSRNCFPGKKLDSESVESNLLWQGNSTARFSPFAGLDLFDCYWKLLPRFSYKKFRRAVSVPWDVELEASLGAARAVESLSPFICMASNILLDGSYHVKISDFGLVKKMGPTAGHFHVSTQVVEIDHIVHSNATGKYDQTLFGSEIERIRSNKACGCAKCHCWALILRSL